MDEASTRYCVGIDLGTTNTVMSYVDRESEHPEPVCFRVTQVVAPGETAELESLPSFIYLPEAGEASGEQLSLPWRPGGYGLAVGAYARDMSATSPEKVVSSAKSWLCNGRIDRHSGCLPLGNEGNPSARLLSPVEASCAILTHLRDNWNAVMASGDESLRLERQTVVLTVPASFDAEARELTVEAATAAGLTFTLLEEPQAAFYAWLSEHESDWREQVGDGDVVLVCDLGGGTSDFSLIAVADVGGELTLQRLAVGDHTLLGGDNMDLALAVKVAARLKAEKGLQLNTRQFISLVHGCRRAKEALSGGGKVKDQSLAILGTGSGLVAGTITTKLSYAELRDTILEGFFPACELTATPPAARRSGMRSFALDYASDPAFTRHLAQFLNRHSFRDGDGNALLPRFVLFNGGVTKAALFRSRIVESLDRWRGAGGDRTVVFTQRAGDLSVALGAAWYAHVRQHGGVRIKAGSPRSYYIGVESPQPAIPGLPAPLDALCVVPFGMEEGTQADIEMRGLALLVGEPTEFRFFSSTTRPDDALGERVPALDGDDLTELSPLAVTLAPSSEGGTGGSLVPVTLRTVLTDIGTLELWCQEAREGGQSWKLEFTVRGDE